MINISNVGQNLKLTNINKIEKININKDENTKFSDILKNIISEANEQKIEADKLTNDFLIGKSDNLHEVMIAAQKAEISIMFVTEVRNRIMDAYQEFSRMQV